MSQCCCRSVWETQFNFYGGNGRPNKQPTVLRPVVGSYPRSVGKATHPEASDEITVGEAVERK
jgi:hypothetical protein